jgi:hypothetical protein
MKLKIKLHRQDNLLLKHLLLEYTGIKVYPINIKCFEKNLFDLNYLYGLGRFPNHRSFVSTLRYIGILNYKGLDDTKEEGYTIYEIVGVYVFENMHESLLFERFYSKKEVYAHLMNAMKINKYAKSLAKKEGIMKRKLRLFR